MKRTKLFAKYAKHPKHTYEISETLSYKDDTGREPDIIFPYSGRNRGKSFEIASQCLADAWYDDRQLAYVRRNEDTQDMICQYFEDKHEFIKDMTDGMCDQISISKGTLYFAHTEEIEGKIKVVNDKELGKFFALSRQNRYRSLQYPKIWNMLFEEVITDGGFLSSEPEKLMNLYSTIGRDRPGFKLYLISNLVTPVNPYSNSWGIYMDRTKPGEVRLTKLYLGEYDEEGNERYYLIAGHYLKDLNQLSEADLKKNKRNRIKTGIASNRWDEARLYPVMDLKFIKQYEILETAVFEWDDMMFQMDILEVPRNIRKLYLEEDEQPMQETMFLGYIRRKSTEPFEETRLYTNNPDRLSIYATKGFKMVYKIDKIIDYLKKNGWIVGCNNLVMNSFDQIYAKLLLLR
ncbi:MAG: phage DNA encapsidation protein [Methanobrevibacter sp.]|nr:phage DNA encapsidation protein [Methanobrevibacter sp.]